MLVLGIVLVLVLTMFLVYEYYSLPPGHPASCGGHSCTAFAPFVALGSTCNSTGLYLTVGNNAGFDVTLLNVSIGDSSGISELENSYDMNSTVGSNRFSICTVVKPCTSNFQNGDRIILPIAGACIGIGTLYSAHLNISYSRLVNNTTIYNYASGIITGNMT